ncbi:MAG: hypothetical protein ACYSUL_13330 [Planctomycetota bacterium]|jgi:hypothetical protein
MKNNSNQIVCEGSSSEIVEAHLDVVSAGTSSVTLETPEPCFEKVAHLYSNKPIRFNRVIIE